jgi:tetratricopeptide (TPR) repeat protein
MNEPAHSSRLSLRQVGLIAAAIVVAVAAGSMLQRRDSPTLQWERWWVAHLANSLPPKAHTSLDIVANSTQIIEDSASNPDVKAMAYMDRAAAYLGQGQIGMSHRDMDSALALKPLRAETVAAIRDERGRMRLAQHNYPGAIADFDIALAASPADLDAYYCRGATFSKTGDYVRALADMNKAIGLFSALRAQMPARPGPSGATTMRFANRVNAGMLETRAAAWRGLGQYANALVDYSGAIQALPGDAKLFSGRGQTYFLNGDWGPGWADLAHAASLSFQGKRPARGNRAVVCAV